MSNTASIKAHIAAVEADMAQAQTLADQLAAMQAAAQRVADCRRDLEHLAGRLAEAETADRMQAHALATYSIQSVKAADDSPTPASRHAVTFKERSLGLYGRQEVMRSLRLDGLPEDLMLALAAAPQHIPAYILALADDPYQALREHAWHAGRGYFSPPKDWEERMGRKVQTFIAPGIEQL